jgi:aspartate racemase
MSGLINAGYKPVQQRGRASFRAPRGTAVKKIGMVGGVTWRSTVEYYAGICELSEEHHRSGNLNGEPSIPEIAIESLDMAKAVALLGIDGDEASWEGFDGYHRAALRRLQEGGADFALMASNTSHHRFPSIVSGIEMPVMDLFEIAAREASAIGAEEVVILGTRMTMESNRMRRQFERLGIRAHAPPNPETRNHVLDLIARLQRGAAENTGSELDAIVRESMSDGCNFATAVCLACTELPLAFPEWRRHGTFLRGDLRYLSTTALHVRAAVSLCFSLQPGFCHAPTPGSGTGTTRSET